MAFMHIMTRRFLIDLGSKSDESVRSNDPSNVVQKSNFWSSVRFGRGSSTTLELQKPGKPEKKRSSSWSSSKQSNVHMKARVSISDGELRAVSSTLFCMPCENNSGQRSANSNNHSAPRRKKTVQYNNNALADETKNANPRTMGHADDDSGV